MNAWDEFQQLLACEGDWLAEAEPLALPLDERIATGYAERNLSALTMMAVLEERRAEPLDDDSPLMQEVARMDAKLTALIHIINHVLIPDALVRPRHALRFNAMGAVLPSALAVAGDTLLLRLRFDACPSLPLELPACVQRRFDDGSQFVLFETISDALREGLERMVFRQHRRRVAVTRQGHASQA
ncbi:PilZ domain-containing protein [Dyella koreensis]|uniref:PilZ domain-containing protein n=1 Tax=Dyella koreensis TaxID=311235 RepID=A0ABW8K161_9GAMM